MRIAIISMLIAGAALLALGAIPDGPRSIQPDDVVAVARICRGGGLIFRYRDGSFHTERGGYTVDSPDEVCAK